MKTTVTLDPNFVDAYLVGSWHLAYNLTAKMEETPPEEKRWLPEHETLVGPKEEYYYLAVDYLEDGVRNNPRNYKLYFDLGFAIYKEKIQDYANAVKHLERAVSLPHEQWVPRQLYICYELNGQYDRAQSGWERYLQEFPDNVNAPRFIDRNKGLKLEEQADALLSAARAEENPEAARDLREQAVRLYREARPVFEGIDDNFGSAQASIIDAKLLALEDRYVEAIALLEYARLASGAAFTEASDLLMAYKQEAGIPLALTEQMELERRSDLARVTAQARAAAAANEGADPAE
jgi:tetratricopeptide (TPR) repeat protein